MGLAFFMGLLILNVSLLAIFDLLPLYPLNFCAILSPYSCGPKMLSSSTQAGHTSYSYSSCYCLLVSFY